MKSQPRPTIALLPWGDLIEDFLDSINVSLEAFCKEMTGGWLFGYIDALRLAGVNTVVFCISARVRAPVRHTHVPTGAVICLLPAPKIYLSLRRRMLRPYGYTVQEMFGDIRGMHRQFYTVLKHVAPYLATPLISLARELRREGCRAILCQEYEYPRFDACVLLGKLLRIPVFATFQGGDWQYSRLERLLRPMVLKACAGLIIATRTEAERVSTKYQVPSYKIARIFNPIDLENWGPLDRIETRAALGVRTTTRVVVWHGRVDVRRKGLDILLDAWKTICQQRPRQDLRLLLIGAGDDEDELQRRITATGLQGILWINQYVLDRVAIRRYLSAADIFVFPSRHEGFPVAPLEAMGCGLAVVAADASGVPDIFDNGEVAGGILVPRNDASTLARALGRAVDDVAWSQKLGACARQRVERCFSLEAVGQQLRAFLSAHGL